MSFITINTENQFYQQVTATKSQPTHQRYGLGSPFYVHSTNPKKIIVSVVSLRQKLHRFIQNVEYWNRADSRELEAIDAQYGTDKDEKSVGYYQRKLIRGILWPNGSHPTAADGIRGGSWFNEYDGAPYSQGSATTRWQARDINVTIANDWIRLIENILDITPGLSESDVVETRQGIDVFSRTGPVNYGKISVNINRLEVPITGALKRLNDDLVQLKTKQFFDSTKEYKTVLNLGIDQQYPVTAWRLVPSNQSALQIKLSTPLKSNIQLYDSAYLATEFANPVRDIISVEPPAIVDDSPVLRPANMNVGKFAINKQSLNNVTIQTLNLTDGYIGNVSASTISYDDRVFNRWYTADFNSSELNVDFSDYKNFVFFSSAKARLQAFANKLTKIQSYPTNISPNSTNERERKLAIEKEEIKRNFDSYEQYLYFASMSNAYSASVFYVDGGVEYNVTGSWPKDSNMNPLSYSNVEDWYVTQSAIAERYDEFNPNNLTKHLPDHILEDNQSTDFIKFIQMFAHVMDNIKLYVDQMPNIYSTNPDPFAELTMDQVYEVAKSFGMDLPNAFSVESLQTFIASLYDGEGARSFLAETWKRFIHSSIFLRKLKGSRTGTDMVLNTYGLGSPLVQVKETTYPVEGNYIKSDELVYALRFTGSLNNTVWVPFVSASYTASTIQIRFVPEIRQQTSLLTNNGTWGIDLIPHPSASKENYGRIHVISGSSRTIIASSSYFPLFSDDYTNLMLRSQSADISIIQSDGDQILFQESASVNLGTLWNTTEIVYLGGVAPIKLSNNFDGVVDELRVWGENTSTENFIKQAYDPGSRYGSTYSSSYNSLYVDLGFSQKYAAITQSATNESPFYDVAKLAYIPAYGFTTNSYVRILRTIKQFTPIEGGTIFTNKKVTVAPSPSFGPLFVDSDGVKVLKVNSSIKAVEDKKYTGGSDYMQFAVSPTDFINQSIIRSMGDIDTNYLIGSPIKNDLDSYKELDKIFEFFLVNYYKNVNINQYIRFFKNVLKAPSEYIEDYVPSRARLIKGVVIESPMLSRKKTYLQKSIKVDGSNTRTFEKFVAGSGSKDVGAYDFFALYETGEPIDTTELTGPTILENVGQQVVTSSISNMGWGVSTLGAEMSKSMGFVSSTPPEKLPVGKQLIQKIESVNVSSSLADRNSGIGMLPIGFTSGNMTFGPVPSTIPSKLPPTKQLIQILGAAALSSSYVSSSLADRNSGIGFIGGVVDYEVTQVSQSGYARNPYLGLVSPNSTVFRIPSENNTIEPFYAVKPISDFSELGTTTYFHNTTGIYNVLDPFGDGVRDKGLYTVKLNVPFGELESAAAREFYSITLLPPTEQSDYPGRFQIKIKAREYTSTTPYRGVLNIANIFSLYKVKGSSGLRLRLYKNINDQINDINRDFSTSPTSAAGVLFDGLLNGDQDAFPYTIMQTEESTMYFTVNNVSASPITSEIVLTYFEYQPANLVPSGYLPRHYKFTRTTPTPSLRRSYLGCQIIYCEDICPPGVTSTDPYNPITYIATGSTSQATVTPTGGGRPPNDQKGRLR